jgi:TPR repeat protein
LTQGDAEAQCNLGGAYYNGSRGLEKDEEKAEARAALLAIERACVSGFYVL